MHTLTPGTMMCGVVRRIQALAARGHSTEWLVNTLGIPRAEVSAYLAVAGAPVTVERWREVCAAYTAHETDDPVRGSWIDRRIEHARESGWVPPEYWDARIDDPYAAPLSHRHCTDEDLETAYVRARRGDWAGAREALPDPAWIRRLALRLHAAGVPMEEIGLLSSRIGDRPRTAASLKNAGNNLVSPPERPSRRADDYAGPRLILATGSRRAVAPVHTMVVWGELARIARYPAPHVMIHGAATGIDSTAARIAEMIFEWETIAMPADWGAECRPTCRRPHRKRRPDGSTYCPAAGAYRNADMVTRGLEICQERTMRPYCLAMPIGWSSGTADCEGRARAAGYLTRRVELTATGRRPPR